MNLSFFKTKLWNWLSVVESEASDTPLARKKSVFLTAAVLALFSFLTMGHFHGFSFSRWHHYIDHSSPNEVLIGKPQEVRSDDWMLDLSLAFAQSQSHFPSRNDRIGLGQGMALPIKTPILGFIGLFRPALWGFFISTDTGLAWNWWFLTFGLFLSSYFLFLFLSGQRVVLSVLAAIALTTSPYWSFWSYHKAEIAIHGMFAATTVLWILFSDRQRGFFPATFFLAYSVACAILAQPYPPILVSCVWALTAVCFGFIAHERAKLDKATLVRRTGAILAGLFLALTCVGFILFRESTAIALISNTVYPGQRISTGGGLSSLLLFGTHFFTLGKITGNVGNVCEAAGFFFFFPVMFIAIVGHKHFRRTSLFPLALGVFILFAVLFSYVGFPVWLAKATLMSRVTSNRTMASLGLAEFSLLVFFLSRFTFEKSEKTYRRGLLGGIVAMAITGILLRATPGGLPIASILLMTLIHGLLASQLLEGRRLFLICLIVMNLAYVGIFNPLTRGGSEFIQNNPLSQAIKRADTDNSRWIVYGFPASDPDRVKALSNFLPMLGIQSLGGYHTHPQFDLWKHFDQTGSFKNAYNISGRITFTAPPNGTPLSFDPVPGQLTVRVALDHPALKTLKVSKILVVGPDYSQMEKSQNFSFVSEVAGTRIYSRP